MVAGVLGPCLGGLYTRCMMGGRDWVFCTHLDFRRGSSYEPWPPIFYKYEYGHIKGVLTSPLRSLWGARDRRAGPSTAEARQDPL